jgi:hypothetical protein
MVTESDRLRGLEMRESRHQGRRVTFSLLQQSHTEGIDLEYAAITGLSNPKPNV